jgi:hypothetical protein
VHFIKSSEHAVVFVEYAAASHLFPKLATSADLKPEVAKAVLSVLPSTHVVPPLLFGGFSGAHAPLLFGNVVPVLPPLLFGGFPGAHAPLLFGDVVAVVPPPAQTVTFVASSMAAMMSSLKTGEHVGPSACSKHQ